MFCANTEALEPNSEHTISLNITEQNVLYPLTRAFISGTIQVVLHKGETTRLLNIVRSQFKFVALNSYKKKYFRLKGLAQILMFPPTYTYIYTFFKQEIYHINYLISGCHGNESFEYYHVTWT